MNNNQITFKLAIKNNEGQFEDTQDSYTINQLLCQEIFESLIPFYEKALNEITDISPYLIQKYQQGKSQIYAIIPLPEKSILLKKESIKELEQGQEIMDSINSYLDHISPENISKFKQSILELFENY